FSARGAEVDQLHVAAVADHHVLRTEVAVHDLERLARRIRALVNVSERFAERDPDGHRVRPRDARTELVSAVAHLAEVSSLDVLDDHERLAALVDAGLEDLRDAG